MQNGEQAGFYMQNYAMPLNKVSNLDQCPLDLAFEGTSTVDLTSLFEHLVNACVSEVSPPPKFMFNT